AVRDAAGEFLAGLRLRLHPHKTAVFPTRQGIPFLGYRVRTTHLGLARDNVWRFRRRLRRLQRLYACRQIGLADAWRRIAGWIGHAAQADTWRLRERLFTEHRFRRAAAL